MNNNKRINQLRRILGILLLCVMVTACHAMPKSLKPGAWILDMVPKEGPPVYRQAWLDGCQSGLGAMTNSMYKGAYQFTQDANLRKDPLYYKTWKDTFTFCRHYVYGTIRQGNNRMYLPMQSNIFIDNVAGGQGVLNTGIFQNLGPSTWGLTLENWGYTGGPTLFEPLSTALDFSGDMLFSKKKSYGVNMDWDFRPTAHSIVPYHTSGNAWE